MTKLDAKSLPIDTLSHSCDDTVKVLVAEIKELSLENETINKENQELHDQVLDSNIKSSVARIEYKQMELNYNMCNIQNESIISISSLSTYDSSAVIENRELKAEIKVLTQEIETMSNNNESNGLIVLISLSTLCLLTSFILISSLINKKGKS